MTTPENTISVSNHASREQLEKIYDILGEVFSIGRTYFQERLDFDSTYNPDTTWFATVNNTIASTVQIFPLHIRVGQVTLKIGAIGSVATHPDFRGLGLAHKILNAQVNWMQQNDYDLSLLLASKHGFYEKVGWKVIPETDYCIQKQTLPLPQTSSEIIPFDSKYLNELKEIYEQYNEKRTYTVVRNETYWNDLLNWPDWKYSDCLLLRKDNKIVAYGLVENKDSEDIYINELVYLEEAGDGVIDLFLALSELRPQAKHILARLPEDHRLTTYFMENAATEIPLHVSMWKIINYNSTLHKLLPELQSRLNEHEVFSTHTKHIDLHCGEEHFYLDYAQQQLTISEVSNPSHTYTAITLDEHDLISYIIFGFPQSDEMSEEANILHVLFPKQNAVFYLTDKF